MKRAISEAPEHVRALVERQWGYTREEAPSPAATYTARLMQAFRAGFDFGPPKTPMTEEATKLKAARAEKAWAEFRMMNRNELEEEQIAVRQYNALADWRSGPSNEEIAAKAKVDRDAAEREQEVEARTNAILAKQRADAIVAARAQATREVGK